MTRLGVHSRRVLGLLLALGLAASGCAPAATTRTAPADPDWRTVYWGLDRINALPVWQSGVTGRGVVVAIVDSGIPVTVPHPDLGPLDLQPNANTCPNEAGKPPDDRNGHGTWVAGVVNGKAAPKRQATGVAWDATVVPYKFLCQSGFDLPRARQAVEAAIKRGADVVNGSWADLPDDDALRSLIAGPGKKALFVFAAPPGGAFAAYGSMDNVIVVTASDQSEGLVPGSGDDGSAIHLAAPGVAIVTADIPDFPSPGLGWVTTRFQGPSAAAAFVSGCAALIKSAHRGITPARLKELILTHADGGRAGLNGRVQNGRRLNCGNTFSHAP